jgi:hypothetical protein
MENFEKILGEEQFEVEIDSQINVAYNNMYSCFMLGDPVRIARKIGTKSEIGEMLDYFSSREEYEKCHFLSKILEKI